MKRILSERNVAALLFVFALVFFVFAQQDAKKVERMYMTPDKNTFTLIPDSKKTTQNISSEAIRKSATAKNSSVKIP